MVFYARPSVMIAEDNPLIIESYENVVTDAGLSVAGSFLSCRSAEDWLSIHRPDVAILDVALQDGDCAALAKELCSRDIPFLVVSGYSANSDGIDEVFKSAPWLEKPVTVTALETALRDLMHPQRQEPRPGLELDARKSWRAV